jgi:glutaredoxin 3
MQPTIVIYTSRYCPYCFRAKALLDSKGLRYQEIVVDDDAALRAEMEQKSGRYTVPQIWVGDTHVGGCDDLHAQDRSGRLETLLQQGGGV